MNNKEQADFIESAINYVMKQIEEAKEDVLIEWMLVAYVDNPNEENSGGYATWVSNGIIPDHKALGLLTQGIEIIKSHQNHKEKE